MTGYYADNSVCDWRPGVSFLILVALFYLGWCGIAHVGAFVSGVVGYPEACVVTGVFGVPILAMLVNGQMGMRREGKRNG